MYHVGRPSCNEHLETIRDQVGHKRCEPLRRAPASPYCSGPWGMKTPVGDDAWIARTGTTTPSVPDIAKDPDWTGGRDRSRWQPCRRRRDRYPCLPCPRPVSAVSPPSNVVSRLLEDLARQFYTGAHIDIPHAAHLPA